MRRIFLLSGVLAAAAVSLAWLPFVAAAADRVYWTNEGANESVSFANIDGSGGGGDLNVSGATPLSIPRGVALDPAAGRLYIANYNANKIAFANLDGSGGGGDLNTSGATMNGPIGVAVYPAAGKVYWASAGGIISFANLDGSGGGDLNTTGATVNSPYGVAIDPAVGRIYWANRNDGISFASLDGSGGGGNLNTAGATVSAPEGVAIDPVGGRIFWANSGLSKKVSFARLDGSGGGDLNTTGATTEFITGVAIDPFRGMVFWGSASLTDRVSFANLDGSGGGGDLNTTGATTDNPVLPALLEAPSAAGSPAIAGHPEAGSALSCSQGTWGADLPGSQLYRAPRSFAFQWSHNGQAIQGATGSSHVPATAGSYTCTVSASNVAGTTSQTSVPLSVLPSNNFTFGKLTRNKKQGTATLALNLPGPGTLVLSGNGIVKQTPPSAKRVPKKGGKVKVLIKAKGKKRRKLNSSGKVKLKAKIAFTPKGGIRNAKTRSVKLIRKR